MYVTGSQSVVGRTRWTDLLEKGRVSACNIARHAKLQVQPMSTMAASRNVNTPKPILEGMERDWWLCMTLEKVTGE